ncbi:hypothetical protein [Hydrogenimonas sp.]
MKERNEPLTAEKLEKELAEAERKLQETEKLIETVKKELSPLPLVAEGEYESGGNCCEDFDEGEGR